jgi:hypothetical protein
MSKIKILVAYHKKERLYKNDVLVPIHCGRALMKQDDPDREWLLENLVGDDTGDNISALNKDYCEMTALYWAWKNYEALGNPDFLGFSHYRRLWYLADDFPAAKGSIPEQIGLTPGNVAALMEKAQVILPRMYVDETASYAKMQPYTRLSEDHYPMFHRGYKSFEEDHRFYSGNMFIFPKEVFFDYCAQIFGLFAETSDYIRSLGKHVSVRYHGIEAEYLTSFYQADLVAQNKYVSKELPIVFLDLPRAIKV